MTKQTNTGKQQEIELRWRDINDLPPCISEEDDFECRCVVVWRDAENMVDIGVEDTNMWCIRDGDYEGGRYHNPKWICVTSAVEPYVEEEDDEESTSVPEDIAWKVYEELIRVGLQKRGMSPESINSNFNTRGDAAREVLSEILKSSVVLPPCLKGPEEKFDEEYSQDHKYQQEFWSTPVSAVELRSLIAADEILEAAQSELRGATRVKEIRTAIRERIKQIKEDGQKVPRVIVTPKFKQDIEDLRNCSMQDIVNPALGNTPFPPLGEKPLTAWMKCNETTRKFIDEHGSNYVTGVQDYIPPVEDILEPTETKMVYRGGATEFTKEEVAKMEKIDTQELEADLEKAEKEPTPKEVNEKFIEALKGNPGFFKSEKVTVPMSNVHVAFEKDERLKVYNLKIGQEVLLRCSVEDIRPNCIVHVRPSVGFSTLIFSVHRDQVIDITTDIGKVLKDYFDITKPKQQQ